MHFYLSLIKQFFLLLLTGESPRIKHWRADTIRPIPGIPFNVEWQVERTLFVRLKGYKKRLPTSGAMLIKVEGPSTVLELDAVGLFSVSKSTLPVTCVNAVALKYAAIRDFSENSQIKKLCSAGKVPKQLKTSAGLTLHKVAFSRQIAPKKLLLNRRISLFQSHFDPKAFNDSEQDTAPVISNPL